MPLRIWQNHMIDKIKPIGFLGKEVIGILALIDEKVPLTQLFILKEFHYTRIYLN